MATFLNRHYSYYTSSGMQCFLFASASCFYAIVRPCIPHVVIVLYICYVLATKAGLTLCLQRKCKTLERCLQATRHKSQAETDVEADGLLPDWLINPREYESVLLTTEEHTAAEPTGESKEEVNEDQRKLIPVYTYGSIS